MRYMFILGTLLMLQISAVVAADKPVKVFILAGQSNMEGHGFVATDPKRNEGKGSLEYLVSNEKTAATFAKFVDQDKKFVVRNDVFISYLDRNGGLTAGYGANKERIGPELGFGWVMGDHFIEPVLLIKCAWGGKSLAIDFRPPSAGKPTYLKKEQLEKLDQNPDTLGHYYRETVNLVKKNLADIKTLVPGSSGSYELIGFGWHQGWNDRINDDFNKEYESNMIHFIKDIRKDLNSPKLPFVIAETGMTGPEENHPRALSLMKAQAAVADHPEFKGNVGFVSTRNFWRVKEESPTGQGYHWNTNAETYYLIGDAMGHKMLELIK